MLAHDLAKVPNGKKMKNMRVELYIIKLAILTKVANWLYY